MQVEIIAIPSVEAAGESSTGPVAPRAGGLARASDAFLAAGLVDQLEGRGVAIAGVRRAALAPEEAGGDRVVDLGRHGAKVAGAVAAAIAAGSRPVLAGGTCNHLPGMLAGLQRAYGATSRIGLVWFDAHGDFNTPKTTRSGMLGGMPVAVAAGLCHPTWREGAGMDAPLPTDRIVFVDVRNLDPEEAVLVEATAATVAHLVDGKPGPAAEAAIVALAERVDHLYLHVDADVLDRRYQPNHPTAEPDGPDLNRTLAAIRATMATDKVRAYAVVSVNPTGEAGATSLASGMALLLEGIAAWEGARG
jgi:arginase